MTRIPHLRLVLAVAVILAVVVLAWAMLFYGPMVVEPNHGVPSV